MHLIENSRFVLAPSKFEGFGLVPGEALCMGKPVIAYDLPVLRENYGPDIIYAPWDNADFFKKLVKVAAREKEPFEWPRKEHYRKKLSFEAMANKCETLTYHSYKRKKISVQCIAYWGFHPESIESVYPYVDEINIAFGRDPDALEVDDGSLERIQALDDPYNKIRLEVRDVWPSKREMRNWCCENSTGNYMLVLDGDEIFEGLDKWINGDVDFGCPRWVHFWHDQDHYVVNPPGWAYARWGDPVEPFGCVATHYRWSWWRRSYSFRGHPTAVDSSGKTVFSTSHNVRAAVANPGCVLYHLGQALPKELMLKKHAFYKSRDDAPANRQIAWHDWDGELGNCGDGIVKAVDWELPELVKKAFARHKEVPCENLR